MVTALLATGQATNYPIPASAVTRRHRGRCWGSRGSWEPRCPRATFGCFAPSVVPPPAAAICDLSGGLTAPVGIRFAWHSLPMGFKMVDTKWGGGWLVSRLGQGHLNSWHGTRTLYPEKRPAVGRTPCYHGPPGVPGGHVPLNINTTAFRVSKVRENRRGTFHTLFRNRKPSQLGPPSLLIRVRVRAIRSGPVTDEKHGLSRDCEQGHHKTSARPPSVPG